MKISQMLICCLIPNLPHLNDFHLVLLFLTKREALYFAKHDCSQSYACRIARCKSSCELQCHFSPNSLALKKRIVGSQFSQKRKLLHRTKERRKVLMAGKCQTAQKMKTESIWKQNTLTERKTGQRFVACSWKSKDSVQKTFYWFPWK